MADFKIPGGKDAGTSLPDAKDDCLKWWLNKKRDNVRQDPQGRYADADRAWIAAAEHELALRQGEGDPPPPGEPARGAVDIPNGEVPPQRSAIQKAPPVQALGQAMHDAQAVTAKLVELAASFHMVSPATHVDDLPEGCGVALSYVTVDVSETASEVYDVGGGKVGLSAVTLSKVASAAGIDWQPEKSGRLDDGSHPHYCHFRAVGRVRNFDGTWRTLTGEVEIDAREDSPQIDEIRQKAAAREARADYRGKKDGGAGQILELRKFLLRHAERKAKSRAIADLGIKRSYTKAELKKPFAVARLMFTGKTEDNELRRAFALKTADAFLGASAALYGSAPARPALLPRSPAPDLQATAEELGEGEL